MLFIRNSALNMAGNIVKWWKHKILRGYKQFSVQECATDSEELMCRDVRTSSSCSAPPDLLVLNEIRFLHSSETKKPFTAKQTIPMTEARSFTSQPDNCTFDGDVHNHPKILQQPPPPHNDLITVINNNNNINQSHNQQHQQQQQFHSMATKMPDETSQQHFFFQDQQNHVVPDEHIRLEEFSCDVSVEGGGKSSQPLQFSFTFYDLDGHHGKITKDDIVGIVYTIYESIGKSVVVPHCGSKTINVRLTFSPEGKTKSTCHPHKHKQSPASGEGGGKLKPSPRLVPTAKTNFAQACCINNRRAHRYRPRKLIQSDDEDDDSTSDKKEDNGIARHSTKAKPSVQNSKFMEKQQYYQQPNNNNNNHEQKLLITNSLNNNNHNTGENASIRKMNETCTECTVMAEAIKCAESVTPAKSCQCQKTCTDSCIKCAVIPQVKANKKYRKYKDYAVSRPRSFSAGNDVNWKCRQLQSKPWCPEPRYAAESMHNSPNIVQSCTGGKVQQDKVRMLTKSNSNSNSLECWKTTFNRNELISIIRKSMEKNRLCFQANSKPYANGYLAAHNNNFYQSVQPNANKQVPVVQLKTRRRSNTTSKIPTLIANHTSMYGGNNYYYMKKNINIHEHHNRRIHNSTPSHVPLSTPTQIKKNNSMNALYGRKSSKNLNSSSITATTNNTTAADGHNSKANLCGYDSFLHATICGSEHMHKQTVNSKAIGDTINQNPLHDQPIAAVKPIMSPIYNRAKNFPCGPNKVNQSHKTKNNKIMHYNNNNNNNNNNNQSYPITIATTQNTPQYYGYQRLSSTNKHNLAALNLISPNTEKSNLQYLEKCRKAQLKNYDQLLYAKLSEKLQQTNMTESSVESQKGITKQLKRFDANQTKQINHGQINAKDNDYMSAIAGGDPLECQHLISQTSDEENQSQTELNDKKMQVKFENMIRNKLELQGKHEMENEQSVCKGKSNGILLVDEDIQTHSKINRSEASHSNEDDCKEAATVAASTNTPVSSGSNTSSLIHRYVHEHIHHHYHHFEDKEQ